MFLSWYSQRLQEDFPSGNLAYFIAVRSGKKWMPISDKLSTRHCSLFKNCGSFSFSRSINLCPMPSSVCWYLWLFSMRNIEWFMKWITLGFSAIITQMKDISTAVVRLEDFTRYVCLNFIFNTENHTTCGRKNRRSSKAICYYLSGKHRCIEPSHSTFCLLKYAFFISIWESWFYRQCHCHVFPYR